MIDQSKQNKLQTLTERMSNELTYELAKNANLVPGEGNLDTEVLFIGEAPGADEDRLRRPFIGRSGQLLRVNIRKLGWKEEDVYITNIVKHRPPENRDPTLQEIEANKPLLDEQIDIIAPLLIVTLGRFSLNKFLPDAKISQVHGKMYKVSQNGKKRFVVPLYHPAAALRSSTMKKSFEEDFEKLPKIVEKVKSLHDQLKLEEAVEAAL